MKLKYMKIFLIKIKVTTIFRHLFTFFKKNTIQSVVLYYTAVDFKHHVQTHTDKIDSTDYTKLTVFT